MEPKDRLKQARTDAGYASPTDAARVLKDINQNTLISHENGNRPISRKAAEKYGQAFGVEAGWILFGEGDQQVLTPIRGDKQILEMLSRIEGLDQRGVEVVFSVITTVIAHQPAKSEPSPADDQHELSTSHHKQET